jgi:chromosome segregation ATPase
VLQVRASSLQELVYKQGQAGVTKASVSITFNNTDRERSPVGRARRGSHASGVSHDWGNRRGITKA